MFRVSISSLGSLLACCTLGTVLLAWFWSEYRDSVQRRKFDRLRMKCSLCFFEFLAKDAAEASSNQERNPRSARPACPRCGAPGAPACSSL